MTQWDGNTQGLIGIGHGSAGMIFAWGDDKVVKVYLGLDGRSIEDFETERQAYRNIAQNRGYCQHVLRSYELDNPHGLVLEKCRGTVRHRIRSRRSGYSPHDESLKLATEAAKGLAFIHRCGIIQGDVGCHNMLLDYQGTLKIADFAGSSVDGCSFPPSVDYEIGSQLPGEIEPSIRTDLFALGSAIYEMITRTPPYKGRSYAEIQSMFMHDSFPDEFEEFEQFRPIVERCWGKGGRFYVSADEVLGDLYRLGAISSYPILETSTASKISHDTIDFKRQSSPVTALQIETTQRSARKTHLDRERSKKYVDSQGNKKRSGKHRRREGGRYHKDGHNSNSVATLVQSFRSLWTNNSHTTRSSKEKRYCPS